MTLAYYSIRSHRSSHGWIVTTWWRFCHSPCTPANSSACLWQTEGIYLPSLLTVKINYLVRWLLTQYCLPFNWFDQLKSLAGWRIRYTKMIHVWSDSSKLTWMFQLLKPSRPKKEFRWTFLYSQICMWNATFPSTPVPFLLISDGRDHNAWSFIVTGSIGHNIQDEIKVWRDLNLYDSTESEQYCSTPTQFSHKYIR